VGSPTGCLVEGVNGVLHQLLASRPDLPAFPPRLSLRAGVGHPLAAAFNSEVQHCGCVWCWWVSVLPCGCGGQRGTCPCPTGLSVRGGGRSWVLLSIVADNRAWGDRALKIACCAVLCCGTRRSECLFSGRQWTGLLVPPRC